MPIPISILTALVGGPPKVRPEPIKTPVERGTVPRGHTSVTVGPETPTMQLIRELSGGPRVNEVGRQLSSEFTPSNAFIDVDYSGDVPLLLNIKNDTGVKGAGYNTFIQFIKSVGNGNSFRSTDMTESGKRMFNRAVKEGFIEQIAGPKGLHRLTEWKASTGAPSLAPPKQLGVKEGLRFTDEPRSKNPLMWMLGH